MKKRMWILIAAIIVVSVSVIILKVRQFSVLEKKKEIEYSIYKKASSAEERVRQEALDDLEKFSAGFSGSGDVSKVWYKVAEIYQKRRDFLKAANIYQRIVRDYPDREFIAQVQQKLWDLNIKILFSPRITEGYVVYEVKAGDNLNAISKKFNTTVELIMKMNNLESAYIRPGKKLKISTAKYSVVADKSQNMLTLKANERIIKAYRVSTGKNDSTPVGTFTIEHKLVDPVWYKQGAVVLPGSPENILGSRWMGFAGNSYGIYGVEDITSVGKHNTQGSIRMTKSDVEELYIILPVGSEVMIID